MKKIANLTQPQEVSALKSMQNLSLQQTISAIEPMESSQALSSLGYHATKLNTT